MSGGMSEERRNLFQTCVDMWTDPDENDEAHRWAVMLGEALAEVDRLRADLDAVTELSRVGHGLRLNGRFGPREPGTTTGPGVCTCGARSDDLPSNSARKRWHKEHVAEVKAGCAPAIAVECETGPV